MNEATIAGGKPVSAMSLVEIAEHLDQVTSMIEAERVEERKARQEYEAVRVRVEARIEQIKAQAKELLEFQRRKMSQFDGLLGERQPSGGSEVGRKRPQASVSNGAPPKNLGDAILKLWTSGMHSEPLTTEEIAESLPKIGYETNAAPASIKSSINQFLAKLCKTGYVLRLRADGSRIPPRDTTSRARKYIAASVAGDE